MLKFNSVSFAWGLGSGPVLRDITLSIESGERVAVMGGNGSGKTTLALLAAGLLTPTSGTIERDESAEQAGLVLQNPDNQIVSISVEHELAFPLECRQTPPVKIRELVDRALAKFLFDSKRSVSPNDLSGGEKQKLALASALIAGPGLLVLDEPVSHLDLRGKELLHEAVHDIRRSNPGLTIIMITQSPSEALGFDRLLVLRNGIIAADGAPERIFSDGDLRESCELGMPNELLCRSIDYSLIPAADSDFDAPLNDERPKDELLRLEHVSFGWQDGASVLNDLDLVVTKGGVLGIAAVSGGGKTTLGYILAGLVSPSTGSVILEGRKQKPTDLLRTVSYLFQFPERQMFANTVHDEIAFGPRRQGLAEGLIDKVVKSSLEMVGLSQEDFAERSPHLLSGGEMRKVALASIVALERPLMFYDEPTAELDMKSTILLKETLRKIRASGRTQIVASHDTDFLFEVCDDILILRHGAVGLVTDKYALLDSAGILDDCGLSVPALVDLCRNRRILNFVKANRLSSIEELGRKLKQIA